MLLPMLGAGATAMLTPTLIKDPPIYDSLRERTVNPNPEVRPENARTNVKSTPRLIVTALQPSASCLSFEIWRARRYEVRRPSSRRLSRRRCRRKSAGRDPAQGQDPTAAQAHSLLVRRFRPLRNRR